MNTPKRTEQNLIVCSSKFEAEVTNTKRQRLRCRTAEADCREIRSIARPVCDSRGLFKCQMRYSDTYDVLYIPGGRWTCWSGRCICLSGMHDWLLWWQQRGGPASDWHSSVLHENIGEEDLEVKHQAGNQVMPLSDIHCASFDVCNEVSLI